MKLKKPKFWDLKHPTIYAYLLLPLAFLIKCVNSLKKNSYKEYKIKTICVGNFYLGGTGKTSLCIKINKILKNKNIKSCFIKKFYKDQIDEQKILKQNGKLFLSKRRTDAIRNAENENYEIAIFDDGLQDKSINYDKKIVCFNTTNWIGNGMTIPAGPLREDINNLRKFNDVFLNGHLKNLDSITEQIYKINPKINIHLAEYIPLNINDFKTSEKFLIFSGIGNHQTFVSMIRNNGLNILKDIEFPDHYNYTEKDLENIFKESKKLNCEIITTEKDYLRLKKNNKIRFIKSELKIIDEEKFIETIL